MTNNLYHFLTNWRVESTIDEVYEILSDATSLQRWWPAVYLDVNELEPGDAIGVGKVVQLHTKGWLPYTLRWQFRVIAANKPHGFALEAWGDFIGQGAWNFAADGEFVNITYDWQIRAEKPLLRALSPILKPIFAANHRWAMAKGKESLKLELLRRRGHAVIEPPGPDFSSQTASEP